MPNKLFYLLTEGFVAEVVSTRMAMLFFVVLNGFWYDFVLSRASLMFIGCLVVCFTVTHRCALYLVLFPA